MFSAWFYKLCSKQNRSTDRACFLLFSVCWLINVITENLSNSSNHPFNIHLSKRKKKKQHKQNPSDKQFIRLIPISSLRPVKKLRPCCTSTCRAGRIGILSAVYLSWTSFMCHMYPQSSGTIDFSL